MKKIKLPNGISIDTVEKIKILLYSSTNCEICYLFSIRELNHPNIVQFHGCAKIDDEFVIVMSSVNGSNLDRMMFGKKEWR